MKHPHYDKIVAKAANTDLVVFYRYKNDEWEEAASEMLVWDVKAEHFLCLPKHKEACLHWLNGGELQINRKTYNEKGDELPSEGFLDWGRPSREWRPEVSFMNCNCSFKVKPKKEKRWIGTCKNFVTAISYPSIDECKDAVGDDTSWEFHEIEVEV